MEHDCLAQGCVAQGQYCVKTSSLDNPHSKTYVDTMHTPSNHFLKEKQPAVIPVFFATEMWERFGFYMIQGLLVLYMTSKVFGFSDEKSYGILGAFTALAYITPIIGGYVASRILDFEHAITLGGG